MPWPSVQAPLHMNLFLSSIHTISTASMLVWFSYMCWLMFIFCDVKDVWAFGLIFSAFHPFLDWALLGAKAHIFLPSPCFPFLCPWAFGLLILPYDFIMLAIALPLFFISCYPMGLWTDTLAVSAHFFINLLLKASLTHFSHLYLIWALLANIPAVLAHFTTSFVRLPRLIYFSFTSFTPMGFLLNSLGFLGPITTSLPLITFRAYWPSSQPIELTNSFHELPQPNYFLFTTYYSHGLTTSFIGLL